MEIPAKDRIDEIKNEIVEMTVLFAKMHPHIQSPMTKLANELIELTEAEPETVN